MKTNVVSWKYFPDSKPELKKGAGQFVRNSGWLKVKYENGKENYASYWENGNWINDKLQITKNIEYWKEVKIPSHLFPLIQERVTKKSQRKLLKSIASRLGG